MILEVQMRRFLAFHFPDHYPSGGWNDFIGSFDTAEEAFAACRREDYGVGDNSQVIDGRTGEQVEAAIAA